MKKIIYILVILFCANVNAQDTIGVKLNSNGTKDVYYTFPFTDGIRDINGNYLFPKVDSMKAIFGFVMPNSFNRFTLTAKGYWQNFPDKIEIDGIAGSTLTGRNLLALATPASTSLLRVNNDGTVGTRTIPQAQVDLGVDLKANINNANFTGTFTPPDNTIDLTTKVTGVLPFINGGSSGTSAAAPATTGAMTVNMTTRMITITPTGACTFNASGGVVGQMITFIITTSGTSSFVMTWGTNFRKAGTLATGTTSARFFAVSFICINGTIWQEISRTPVQT